MMQRKTIQCALVLDAVKALKCHPTADEVYETVRKEHPTVSRTTVYRNLQRLCERGEVLRIEVPDAADRFDHTCHSHYHVKCTRCGCVEDVDMVYLTNVEDHIQDAHGFLVTGYELIFKGVCPACQAADAASPPPSL